MTLAKAPGLRNPDAAASAASTAVDEVIIHAAEILEPLERAWLTRLLCGLKERQRANENPRPGAKARLPRCEL